MIIEGVKLMFIGMSTVLVFLTLMIFLINVVARITRKYVEREVEMARKERVQRTEKADRIIPMPKRKATIAVITAAVAAYEADQNR